MSDRVNNVTGTQPNDGTPAGHLSALSDDEIREAVELLRDLSVRASTIADHLESSEERSVMVELRKSAHHDGRGLVYTAMKAEQAMAVALTMRRVSVRVGRFTDG